MSEVQPILEFENLGKSFGGTAVLRNIRLALQPGSTMGLVGENGAGKSTLMNILGGNLQPDAGAMRLNGQLYAPRSPQDATAHGIAFIHQELNLFGNLSIAENLFLANFPRTGSLPIINRKALRQRAAALLQGVGLNVSPATLVEKLSAGEQQLVEIAKALSIDARLIIFDEPTTSLTSRETERLFVLIRQLQARGLSLIYISHNLDHVLGLCDQVAVLRDGELVSTGPAGEYAIDRLVSLMVGRSISQFFPARTAKPGTEPVLEARHLSQPGVITGISFKLHAGEVLGLSGLMGSGRSELARILFGLDGFETGQVLLRGEPIHPSPRRSIRRGVAFLTENRREEGLCLEASIRDNIALVTLPRQAKSPAGWLNSLRIREAVEHIRRAVRLTTGASDTAPVKNLSGGNQQKVVLAKWLLAKPSVLILDEPTRGIDIGAKAEIYQLINDLAAGGAGILIISSELEELIGLCDRILVMSRGQITNELSRADFDRERILSSALAGGKT